MQFKTLVLASAVAFGLAACGDTIGEQALFGTAIGAGTAVVAGGTLAKGAAVGAAGNLLFCQAYPGRC